MKVLIILIIFSNFCYSSELLNEFDAQYLIHNKTLNDFIDDLVSYVNLSRLVKGNCNDFNRKLNLEYKIISIDKNNICKIIDITLNKEDPKTTIKKLTSPSKITYDIILNKNIKYKPKLNAIVNIKNIYYDFRRCKNIDSCFRLIYLKYSKKFNSLKLDDWSLRFYRKQSHSDSDIVYKKMTKMFGAKFKESFVFNFRKNKILIEILVLTKIDKIFFIIKKGNLYYISKERFFRSFLVYIFNIER